MKIAQVIGREIYDSRGMPTIECTLVLDDGRSVTSSVPSGKSKGNFEAHELRDRGSRLGGMGVSKAITLLENEIAPLLIGVCPELVSLDLKMLECDGTADKSKLGANTLLAASSAVLKAQAAVSELEPYEMVASLCEYDSVSLPFPMFNIINGGAHADNALQTQEFMIMPVGTESFRAAMEVATTFFHVLHNELKKQNKVIAVGDEGGYAVDIATENEVFDLLMTVREQITSFFEGDVVFALDIASDQFYDKNKGLYHWYGKQKTAQDMINIYVEWVNNYPIYSIEDGLASTDWLHWQELTRILGDKIQIVGDDLFATNAQRIARGIEELAANAVIIKPNQIGTVTETLQAIKLCKEYGMNCIISHRSRETNDTLIVDLAIGTSAGQIKAGGPSRGERIAKYNKLLNIEDDLMMSLLSNME